LARGFAWVFVGVLLAGAFAVSFFVSFLLASETADPAVPDLTGREVPEAVLVLEAVGLKLAEAGNRFHDEVPRGRIAAQEPAPGTTFKRGRSVQVFTSLGPTRSRVPRLEGSTLTEARRELEERGVRHWTVRSLVGKDSDQVFVPDPFGNIIELHQIGTCRCNRIAMSD